VKHALGTSHLTEALNEADANRPGKERLSNEDGALYALGSFFTAAPGSSLFFHKVGPQMKVELVAVAHDDDKSVVVLPPTPYAYAIKTSEPDGSRGILSCIEFGVRTSDALTDMEDVIRQVPFLLLAQPSVRYSTNRIASKRHTSQSQSN
jgi:hypothetical protein